LVINKELLQLRKKIAEKRPEFVRQESWRYKKLASNWRKPKGKDNKMRQQVSGVPRLVKVGYKGPRISRGLHPSGYNDVLVFNTRDLTKIDPKKDAVRIAHGVGNKKRIDIVTEATKLKIKILNPGKIEAKKLPEKVETKPKKEAEAKVETKPKKEAEAKAEAEAKVETKPKKEAEAKAKAEAKVETKPKKEAEAKGKKEVKGKSLRKKVAKS
jgi:large subunit ribosomal protein L32e